MSGCSKMGVAKLGIVAVAMALSSSLVADELATAQATGGGELTPGYVRATAADLGAGAFAGGGLPVRAPSTESPFVWHRATTGSLCVVFAGPPPADLAGGVTPIPGPSTSWPLNPGVALDAPPGAVLVHRLAVLPPDAIVVGEFVVEVGDNRDDDNDILLVPRCIRPGAPPLTVPPSAAAIWQETPLPRTQVHASPPGTREWPGITRLGTDFSGVALPVTAAHVSLHGFEVDVVARPVGYAWAFGEGTNLVAPDPTARTRVAYLRRGDFDVALYVVWDGRARLSAFGLDVGELDLGTVTIPERVPYRVAEIRAVLRTSPRRR